MDDLISRQAAIKAIRCGHLSAATVYGRSDKGMMVLAESIRAINSLPSAQPERKKGKWIKEPYSEGLVTYRCSECMKAMGLGSNKSKWYKYCPNCGADMRGEE